MHTISIIHDIIGELGQSARRKSLLARSDQTSSFAQMIAGQEPYTNTQYVDAASLTSPPKIDMGQDVDSPTVLVMHVNERRHRAWIATVPDHLSDVQTSLPCPAATRIVQHGQEAVLQPHSAVVHLLHRDIANGKLHHAAETVIEAVHDHHYREEKSCRGMICSEEIRRLGRREIFVDKGITGMTAIGEDTQLLERLDALHCRALEIVVRFL